ncbi:phosphate ABC transporter permease PstA [Microbulbifer marinus]|uniref:Phosphate transport system permease protein PstA n=1 Tax=Microbulbifer marinus TaxID=658218 RepID=A0A1H3Z058_9GAMM|nr:phosphate ABC transporter permease PstA [Microbulbifer marinus]SEA17060.1 phosphate ABC transporter membrane protein 2, PhoT family [Microbulbifer marinus]
MTDLSQTKLTQQQVRERIEQRLASRHRKEKIFRGLGIASIAFGMLAVLVLFTDIISKGSGAFVQSAIELRVHYDEQVLGIDKVDDESLAWANFTGVIREALRERFPEASSRSEKRELYSLVSTGAPFTLRDRLEANPELLGQTETVWLTADDDVDTFVKSLSDSAEGFRGRTSDQKAGWIEQLMASGELKKRFNTTFFTNGDSREPEQAGIRAALMGSLFTLLVTLALSFPIGVAAAIYLEEYAPKNRWTDLIEVNINNLAAVPSIVFGLLGLAIFINFFELPRSAPLVGGLVLTLMTLPTIIISSRAALKAVPPSIREAAMGMGASRMQVVFHHVLPLAMPGMLTGAIIGMAQALGETAPLLMIGMVAFIVDVPGGITDPSTVLPVQIFLWADSPERAFVERTSAAIMVLLSVLILMNASAVLLRKKLERRW